MFYLPEGDGGRLVSDEEMEAFIANFPDCRTVKLTELAGGYVSTVFLFINHNHSNEGPPILFETMIFHISGYDQDQYRYASREKAIKHHDQLVQEIRDRFGRPWHRLNSVFAN